MIEVEVKLPVEDLRKIEEKLAVCGFVESARLRETDIYFKSEFHDFRALDEALRIRSIEDLYTNKITSVITFKGAKLDKISMSRPELETMVGDFGISREILERIGFTPVTPVEKLRKIMKKDDVEACLDMVTGLGTFLELEIMADEESKDEALKRIALILDGLGLSFEDTVRNSYLSMLLNQQDK